MDDGEDDDEGGCDEALDFLDRGRFFFGFRFFWEFFIFPSTDDDDDDDDDWRTTELRDLCSLTSLPGLSV